MSDELQYRCPVCGKGVTRIVVFDIPYMGSKRALVCSICRWRSMAYDPKAALEENQRWVDYEVKGLRRTYAAISAMKKW